MTIRYDRKARHLGPQQQDEKPRHKWQRQSCPVDQDCDWSADRDDHHAVWEHMREHLR